MYRYGLTSSFLLHLNGSFGGATYFLFFLLLLTAPVEILDNHTHKHVQDEEADEQNECNEIK